MNELKERKGILDLIKSVALCIKECGENGDKFVNGVDFTCILTNQRDYSKYTIFVKGQEYNGKLPIKEYVRNINEYDFIKFDSSVFAPDILYYVGTEIKRENNGVIIERKDWLTSDFSFIKLWKTPFGKGLILKNIRSIDKDDIFIYKREDHSESFNSFFGEFCKTNYVSTPQGVLDFVDWAKKKINLGVIIIKDRNKIFKEGGIYASKEGDDIGYLVIIKNDWDNIIWEE